VTSLEWKKRDSRVTQEMQRVAIINMLDADRQAMFDARDWQGLALGRESIDSLIADLKLVADQCKADLITLGEQGALPDGRELAITEHSAARRWESQKLLAHIVRTALDPEGTGEIPSSPIEAVSLVVEALSAALPLTASLSWRVTPLIEMGVPISKFSERGPAQMRVTIKEKKL
jgi:hypothetical protein